MTSKPILIVVTVSVLALGLTVASAAFMVEAAEESPAKIPYKPSVPRYSETCAHGHNGFDCKQSSLRSDVNDLKDSVTELENHR